MRADDDLKSTVIVFVSAKALLEERIKGLEFGADEYISKPFDHEELLFRVRSFLKPKPTETGD